MSFYTCFDWFKKLRLFSSVRNLKIDVVLKASRAIVIRWFSLNEEPLGLFELIYKDWSKLFVRFIRNNLNQVVHTLSGLHGVYNLIEVISSWTEQKLRSILKCHFFLCIDFFINHLTLCSGEVYSIQHYVFCQWLASCRLFSLGTPVSSSKKTDRHDITEILLKVVLNKITITPLQIRITYTGIFCDVTVIVDSN